MQTYPCILEKLAMRYALMMTATVSLLVLTVSSASAQKIDANGRCHAKNGQFAKMDVCKGAAPVAAAVSSPAMVGHTYKLDTKGKCHDGKGKMAKKELCTH
jgi:hypothetical protein